MTTPRLCRTFQTAPAAVSRENTAKYLESGLRAEGFERPDWLVPDLEDGTAPDVKDEALSNVTETLPGAAFAGEIWPRVEWSHDDAQVRERGRDQVETLVREVGEYVDGVVVPKVGRVDDVERALSAVADAESEYGLPDGDVEVSVIVETAAAASDLRRIAALGRASRLRGLVFGPVDYTADLGGREIDGSGPDYESLLWRLSNEASAAGLVAIGGPYDRLFRERAGVRYYNAEGYADQATGEARLGLDGSWSLHPKQTAQANRVHMPDAEELARDVDRIEAFHEARTAGTGAVTVDGQMVDEATFRTFANTVGRASVVAAAAPEQATAVYGADLLSRALDLDTTW
ncbi:MAG: L-malyl-CoA/beta-methylmalyl-CoA lyase [Haloferacaceae archaeon]